jgi:glutamine amidotransferase-like uncharacterized protein
MKYVWFTAAAALVLIGGCSTAYYKAWQEMGYEKRDILVARVQDGKDSQQAAAEQFKTTLQKFQEVTNFNGGDLEAEYDKLNDAYNSCVSRANAVNSRIQSIDAVAQDMFTEWNGELAEYQNPDLRAKSQQELDQTKDRYAELIALMRKSAASMQPVLSAFHDQVLFLKHNLNAQAIASLQTTAAGIDSDVQKLIAEMNESISEASNFISNMKS